MKLSSPGACVYTLNSMISEKRRGTNVEVSVANATEKEILEAFYAKYADLILRFYEIQGKRKSEGGEAVVEPLTPAENLFVIDPDNRKMIEDPYIRQKIQLIFLGRDSKEAENHLKQQDERASMERWESEVESVQQELIHLCADAASSPEKQETLVKMLREVIALMPVKKD